MTLRSLIAMASVVVAASAAAVTDIVRDGSVGADASLQPTRDANGVVEIGEAHGERPGGGVNLFHSFSSFSVGAGDTALFSADPNLATLRIISRVTGNSPSLFDGTLASNVPGADLYLGH